MAKYAHRIKAQKMRRSGNSILTIARKLSVSKSTVSLWCREIALNDTQIKNLKENQKSASLKGRLIGAEVNKKKRLEAITSSYYYGHKTIGIISSRERTLIATALYWSEGSKSESTTGFQFINSDPDMIILMKNFLVSDMGVLQDDIVCAIQINEIHKDRIKKVLIFWKNLLDLNDEQIRKPYFVKTKVAKVYENHDTYYGVCRLIVRKSTMLKYKMLGLIKAIKNDILPV